MADKKKARKQSVMSWAIEALRKNPKLGLDKLQERALKKFGATKTIENHFSTVLTDARKVLIAEGAMPKDAVRTRSSGGAAKPKKKAKAKAQAKPKAKTKAKPKTKARAVVTAKSDEDDTPEKSAGKHKKKKGGKKVAKKTKGVKKAPRRAPIAA